METLSVVDNTIVTENALLCNAQFLRLLPALDVHSEVFLGLVVWLYIQYMLLIMSVYYLLFFTALTIQIH